MYEIVLAIRERQGGPEHLDVALSLNNLASLYATLGRYAEALPLQQRALAIREKRLGPEHLETALSLNNLAATYNALGQYPQSLQLLQRALVIREKVLGADHPDTASTLHNIAFVYRRLAQFDRALPLYERVLAIYEERLGPDHPDVAITLTNLAEVHEELGQHEPALALHQRALAIREKSLGPEHKETANSLNNVAAIEKSLGRFDLALPLQLRALAIHEKAVGPDHPDTAISLNNLAHTYRLLNQYDKALPLYERALKIREKVYGPDHPDVAVILNNLGELHGEQGHFALALPLLQRALAIRERAYGPNHPETANSLNNLAETRRGLGQLEEALELHRRALAIREKAFGADDPHVAVSLNNIGTLYWTQGARDAARAQWLRALPVAAQARNFETLWRLQSHLRLALATAGDSEQAIYWGKASVNTIQSARANLGSVDLELQQSFLDDKRGEYKQLAALLIDAGRLAEAEQVLALLKDYEFSQLLHRGAGAGGQADPVGPEKAATDEYTAMVNQAIARAREFDALERRARIEKLSDQDEARRRALQEEATDWRAQFQQWLGALQTRLAGVPTGAGTPGFDRKQVTIEATRLQTMVRVDEGAVGLVYVVTPEQLSVVIATARGSFGRRIEIRAVELNRRVEALRQALADPARDPRPAATALYRVLIEPIAADLDAAQARTLVLSLTDNLRYIPFAALYDGRRYLVERYAIGQIVAGASQRIEADHGNWEVAAFGMTRAAEQLPALPGVRVELESIVRGTGRSGGVLPGTIRLDQDFNRGNLEAALRGEHRVVHIGSHFVLRPGSEETSFLLLGDGNHLDLDQIATLDFTGLDQLTLSACDTARGGGLDDNGAEVEGLATIVARQGAASVLASLWPVSDRSTAALMHDFYAGRAPDATMTRAQALQRAQLDLLRGAGQEANSAAPPFAHPYYWAPFILMGNWL
jgi:CHAT domain-containing protein/Tfp pilus assembly protein PilF